MAKGGSVWALPKRPAGHFPRLLYAERYLNATTLQRKFAHFLARVAVVSFRFFLVRRLVSVDRGRKVGSLRRKHVVFK